jgi:hypothetical protein
MAAYSQPSRTDIDLDIFVAYTSQFHADSKAGGALENVDLRPPLRTGFLKLREVNLSKLIGDFADFTLNEAEAQGAGFSTHSLQWT